MTQFQQNIANQHAGFTVLDPDGVGFVGLARDSNLKLIGDGNVLAYPYTGVLTFFADGRYDYKPAQSETNYSHLFLGWKGIGLIPDGINLLSVPYYKNIAGQRIGFTVVTPAGVGVTSGVTISLSKDGGAEVIGAGVLTSKADGHWIYDFAQADVNCEQLHLGWSGVGIAPSGINIFTKTYVAPPEAGQVQATIYTFDEYAELESGVTVYLKMLYPPIEPGIYSRKIASFVSVAGMISGVNVYPTATYQYWRGVGDRYTIRIPDDAETPYIFPPIMGEE